MFLKCSCRMMFLVKFRLIRLLEKMLMLFLLFPCQVVKVILTVLVFRRCPPNMVSEETDGNALLEQGTTGARARLKLNPTDWRTLEKVHAGLGHPPNEVLVRVLKYGRARPELVIAAKDWNCLACKVNKKPKRAPPSMPPITYQLNNVVGLDVIFIKDHAGNTRPCLNMVDWGTGFQIVVSMNDREGESIRDAYRRNWRSFLGVPRVVVIDQEAGFLKGVFPASLSADGAEVVVTSARSPWQAGKTERAGGTWKDVFNKVCQSHPLYSQRNFEEILDSTSVACN
ncbi:unnamed protein product [Polarella glacialis]|uniref:Integrase catalytic domain-containing protein n=1 Tax=Polarella glacialis TaxID=89957 RepID=A0A813FRE5_POLGL|nr:unnamed protein product [Polarella glacialis]